MTDLRRLLDKAVRPVATAANRARKRLRKARGKPRLGAHAIALTPAGRVVLLKLRYARGWRLPGGGREAAETVVAGALRELREETGMTGHGAVRPLANIDPALVLVEDVLYSPLRWSWEVERLIEADLDALPPGMSPRAGRWLLAFRETR
jgi:8-oxo-dGTP pyrophosphatase MutT (NUDIX family)